MYSRNLFQFKYKDKRMYKFFVKLNLIRAKRMRKKKKEVEASLHSLIMRAMYVFFKKYDERSIKHFTETSDLDWLNVCIYHEIRIHK